MFEFAISQHRKRRPTPRFIVSLLISFLAHGLLLLVLFLFPELLEPGRHLWFHPPALFTRSPEDTKWRPVLEIGGLRGMQAPSSETIKKYLYNFRKEVGAGAPPPIRISLNKDVLASRGDTKEPVPEVRPALGTQDPKPIRETAASTTSTVPVGTGDSGVKFGATATPGAAVEVLASNPATDKKATIYLPTPSQGDQKRSPKKGLETPGATPSQINTAAENSQRNTNPARPQEPVKVFENEQTAVKTEGSGFFDTKGFPLGEYASAIIARIKGNWSIPSNLRNSQGRTTIIFYIEKDGQFTGLRVVSPSGSESLDLAALNSVLGSNPFPPLPKGFPGEHVGAKILFSYNERQ